MIDAHQFDLDDGWCHVHRRYCDMTEDPKPRPDLRLSGVDRMRRKG